MGRVPARYDGFCFSASAIFIMQWMQTTVFSPGWVSINCRLLGESQILLPQAQANCFAPVMPSGEGPPTTTRGSSAGRSAGGPELAFADEFAETFGGGRVFRYGFAECFGFGHWALAGYRVAEFSRGVVAHG